MNTLKEFWMEEDGIGVVEMILILVILIALVLIFKDQITSIISEAFSKINDGAGTINEDISI